LTEKYKANRGERLQIRDGNLAEKMCKRGIMDEKRRYGIGDSFFWGILLF
jgi:hypothetical protein